MNKQLLSIKSHFFLSFFTLLQRFLAFFLEPKPYNFKSSSILTDFYKLESHPISLGTGYVKTSASSNGNTAKTGDLYF